MLNYDGYEDFDATINTPGAILQKASSVNAEMNQLAMDITESRVSDSFKSSWAAFKKQWDDYYTNLQTWGGWMDRLWVSTLEQIEDYERRLVEWQTKFRSSGGQVAGPLITPPTKSPGLGEALGNLKWVAFGVGGLWLLSIFAPEIKMGVRALGRRKR